MYAQITLHRRVPSKFESFTYRVPEDTVIKIGQLVTVPFRNQKLSGIVRSLHTQKPAYATKNIEAVAPLVLSQKQLDLAEFLCTTYSCSFSQAIDFFIPENVWQQKSGEPWQQDNKNPVELSAQNLSIKNFIEKISAAGSTLIVEDTVLPRQEFYEEISKKAGQHVILMPETFYVDRFSKNFAAYHGALHEKEKAAVWQAVAEGKIKTVIGTRAALFLPFQNLQTIIIDFEHHESYLEKRTPHYDAHEVAEKLGRLHQACVIFMSSSPRVETWHRAQASVQKTAGQISSHTWRQGKNADVHVIDMKNELRKGNRSLFAEETITKIAATLARKEQALLFLNRRGEYSALYCADCGEVFRCGSCASPLTIHGQHLQCHHCKKAQEMPLNCSQCHGVNLKKLGAGTELLAKEIRHIFGNAHVCRIDKDRVKKSATTKALTEAKEADIIVATQLINKPLDLPRLSLVVFFNPEQTLNFPDFRAEERLWQQLTQLRHLTKDTGEMLMQTSLAELPLFSLFAENRVEDFYKNQLETRASLKLPPFNNL